MVKISERKWKITATQKFRAMVESHRTSSLGERLAISGNHSMTVQKGVSVKKENSSAISGDFQQRERQQRQLK